MIKKFSAPVEVCGAEVLPASVTPVVAAAPVVATAPVLVPVSVEPWLCDPQPRLNTPQSAPTFARWTGVSTPG